jgi:hypothetical protein
MGSLNVHVKNRHGTPAPSKRVACIFPADFTNSAGFTDSNGLARFEYVPVCTAEVYVDGTLQLKVGVGAGEHKNVTVTL